MTEITDKMTSDAAQQFILYWGDMGNQWGVNRSVAQIHALLYLSTDPKNAEQIAETLGIARSNVSNSLKELVGWKLIRRVPVPGDRREHFVAEADVWEMAMLIAQGRKEREIDPAISAIAECVRMAKEEPGLHPDVVKRMKAMQDFLGVADRWYSQMLQVPKTKLMMLMKMGSRVFSFLGKGGETPKS
ncbi:MAG: MarR family transcriptional regulator [Pseudomonadota bacterium]